MTSRNEPNNALAYIRHCQRARSRLLAEVHRQAQQNHRRGKRAARRYLHHKGVRIAAIAEQLAKRQKAKGLTEEGAAKAIKLADDLDLWRESGEFVGYVPKDRNNGKRRWHHLLGVIESARNQILKDVVRSSRNPHPRQFVSNGGLPAFEAWLAEALLSAGSIITTDIPNCHGSARWSSVTSGLPLPRRVMEAALPAVKERAKPLVPGPSGKQIPLVKGHPYYEDYIAGLSSPGRGIPTGAALSADASEALIQNVLEAAEAAAPGVHAGAHSDNLIFVLKDASARASVINAVTSSVAAHFGLDVIDELTRRTVRSKPGNWFQFCGVEYRTRKGKLQRRTAEARIENFRLRTLMRLSEAQTPEDFEGIRNSIRGWTRREQHSTKAFEAALDLTEHWAQLSSS